MYKFRYSLFRFFIQFFITFAYLLLYDVLLYVYIIFFFFREKQNIYLQLINIINIINIINVNLSYMGCFSLLYIYKIYLI